MLRGSYILCCLLIFVKYCLYLAYLVLLFICYDCNKLIINMFLNVCFFDLKIKFISLKFIRPTPNCTFNVHNLHGIQRITRLWVGLSHFREYRFRHNFQDSLDLFCNYGKHIETTIRFFLYCSNDPNQRKTLFDKISNMQRSLFNQNDCINDIENALIIESTIECIITTEKFIAPLLSVHLSRL